MFKYYVFHAASLIKRNKINNKLISENNKLSAKYNGNEVVYRYSSVRDIQIWINMYQINAMHIVIV